MHAKFELTEDAVVDLEQAIAFLAAESESAALNLADDLEHAFLFLSQWPGCGHRRPDLTNEDDLRCWSSSGYLILYRMEMRPILIISVLHSARDAVSLMASRSEAQ